MRRPLALILAAVTAALCLPAAAGAQEAAGSYIVVLKDGNARGVASQHARQHGASVRNVYEHALRGYAATIPNDRVAKVRADARVAYVEADGVMTASAKPGSGAVSSSTQTLPWGIGKVAANLSSTSAGNGFDAVGNVNVYVIDSGVDAAHRDLDVVGHVNFAGGPNKDCNGHGTHVAGTAAARDNAADVVGVAPGAPVIGVKVLGCDGSGTTSGVIAGVDWVTGQHDVGELSVANVSLGGGVSAGLDQAVRDSAADGVFYALAAGNAGADACNSSPARAGAGTNNGIMTVAATDLNDFEASWSNYGSCVDIWAPGVGVLSTKSGGGTTTMSGTSMASPHSAGGGALYLGSTALPTERDKTPVGIEAALKTDATTLENRTSKDGRRIMREYVGGF